MAQCRNAPQSDPYAVPNHVPKDVIELVPEWAAEAIWYQIFVERFRDGDRNNQPNLQGIRGSWPHKKPESWAPTRWTSDWYAQEDWAIESGKPFYETVHMRRYGGDLQGVIDKLDYLSDLGINAIYFNPLNDSPSLHKYDVRNYHHIDIFFGPDPEGDLEIMRREDPSDPTTWEFTSADKLFLELIQQARNRNIRVILDYSWNHTGITFWAWRDVLENHADSPYADWYRIDGFTDAEGEAGVEYTGWVGVRELPEFRRHNLKPGERGVHGQPLPGDLHPDLKRHIFAVTRRWLDPYNNGDISKGVDGFRLDVAELVPAAFWRDYRKFVRSIREDAYLVGELWWKDWPTVLLNPNPWLQGDIFDANMNYRWYMPTRSFFGNALPLVDRPSQYVRHIDSVTTGTSRDVLYAQMNLTSSHDAPRFMTSMLNRGEYKYRVNPRENRRYNLRQATDRNTLERMDLLLLKQFTDVGAPHIWMGDEMGMWGADDPDTRKPLIWPDMQFDDESADPFGRRRGTDPVAFDHARHDYYRTLAHLRRDNPVFARGGKTYTLADDERNLLIFERYDGDRLVIVVLNNDDNGHSLLYRPAYVPEENLIPQGNPSHDWEWREATLRNGGKVLGTLFQHEGVAAEFHNGDIRVSIPPRKGAVFVLH